MSIAIKISLVEGLYIKDPQDSKLGRRIIEHSIDMIDEFGFENFTFRKLASTIESTEASVYRYFENKHMLLLYLVNWYWEYVSYLIHVNTMNVSDPKQKLKIVVKSFVVASNVNPIVEYVNESKLHNIVRSEGIKTYRTKGVDDENSKGFFKGYKKLATDVSDIISEVNPDFKYPYALATSLFEMSNDHIYFAKHLPTLTDINDGKNEERELEEMLNYFTSRLLS